MTRPLHRTPARLLGLSALTALVALAHARTAIAASPSEAPEPGAPEFGAPELQAFQDETKKKQDPPRPRRIPRPNQGGGVGKTPPKPLGGGKEPGQNPPPAFSGEKDPKAKLSVDFGKEKHSFGSCRQGDLLEHTFVLQSAGENPVKIRQASPTCGCTVTGVKIEGDGGEPVEYKLGDPIEPGTKVFITGSLDTASKKNKTSVKINVYTNDPIGLTQLALQADIEPFLRVTPPFINMGDIKEGETKTQHIDIRTSRGEAIGLELDKANPIPQPDGMDIVLTAINPGEDGRAGHWRATVTVGEGAKEGAIGYQLRLKSDRAMPAATDKLKKGQASTYTANASINGRILGALSYTPQFVSLGLVRPGQRVPRNVKVISHDPSFDLSKLKVELRGEQGKPLQWAEHFSTSVAPASGLANAVDVRLTLEGLPDGSDGSFRGIMVILTGNEAKPELQVRFSGVCRSGIQSPTPKRRGGK